MSAFGDAAIYAQGMPSKTSPRQGKIHPVTGDAAEGFKASFHEGKSAFVRKHPPEGDKIPPAEGMVLASKMPFTG